MGTEAVYNDVKVTAHKKVWGEHSLTVGEIVLFLLGVALIFGGTKVGVPSKYTLPMGLVLIGIGQAVF